MHHHRRRSLSLAACLAFALSCGGTSDGSDDDDDVDGTPPASLVGRWSYDSVTVGGTPQALGDVLDWVPGAVAARLQVLANGAFVYEEVNAQGGQLWAESGFVFVVENEVDVNVEFTTDGSVDEMTTLTFMVSDDTLTLIEGSGEARVVFTLSRLP